MLIELTQKKCNVENGLQETRPAIPSMW